MLILVTSTARRGAEVFATQLAAGLPERGWSASVVALAPSAGEGARIDVPTLATSSSGMQPGLVQAVAAAVRRRRPSVVIANGGATLRYAVAGVRGRRRRPRLVYGSIGEPMYWVRSDIHRKLLKVQLSACDSIVAVSNATRSQLVDRVGVAPSKVTVAATGVSPRWLDLGTDPASEPLRLVWVGSLSKEKDPTLALDAFIEADVAGSTLRFVGDGPLRAELEARGVPGVEFVGAVSDVAPHLEQAGALLLSSRTEGLPGVVLEALGAGLPVIGTAVGGVGDVVTDDVTGHVVAPGDVGAMAERIRRLAADPAGRARMGAAGRRLVGESYLLSHSIDRYDAALRDVLKGATS